MAFTEYGERKRRRLRIRSMMGRTVRIAGFGLALAAGGFWAGPALGAAFHDNWPAQANRTWIGPEYWANRLQDWKMAGGKAVCVQADFDLPLRSLHLLTHRIDESQSGAGFEASVVLGLSEQDSDTGASSAAMAGFLLGAGHPDLDYRAAALVHHATGAEAGVFAGIDGTGRLVLHDLSEGLPGANAQGGGEFPKDPVRLLIRAQPEGGKVKIELTALDAASGNEIGRTVTAAFDKAKLTGNIALISHPGVKNELEDAHPAAFWFQRWEAHGSALTEDRSRLCGPILCTHYTLSRGILKLTAQLMPLGEGDSQSAALQILEGDKWKTIGESEIVAPGWTATFRVTDWNDSMDVPFRAVYDLATAGGVERHVWSGTIRKDPVMKPTIAIAGFTGNHNTKSGVDRPRYDWLPETMWFPHNDIVKHVSRHRPDLLFFSGDQVYEGASPTRPDRSGEHGSYLDYLYKWYLYCWAYRDLTKDIPSIVIPDDHDVFQPNLWGQSGRYAERDDEGGYIMPVPWVQMVERTQTSHLPDPYDPAPVERGIGVYYTDLVYGEIGIAVLEDRKFKTGPRGLAPPTDTGRPDHINDPDFDPSTADVPGAVLLGERQLEFLRHWAKDWRGTEMKTAVSQTIFAGMATHHGANLEYLIADLDSNGWPQTGRDKALHELRRGFAFMIGGDQHLATIVHHGIDDWGDAGWSFCVPSIANFYPRKWDPPQENQAEDWDPKMPDYTGQYKDGLGNYVTVYAATNPGKDMGWEPKALHNRMPGYGVVKFNKTKREITMECWPRHVDPSDRRAKQYDGWPKTIGQTDNYGREAAAHLPTLNVIGLSNPVVQVIDQDTEGILYTLRVRGTKFRPKVFKKDGLYRVAVSDPEAGIKKVIDNVSPAVNDEQNLQVGF